MRDNTIPHSRPSLGDAEVEAVVRVLRSGHLSQGPVVQEFERKFADSIGKKSASATSSGTSALHLALLALGVREGDEVIIPSFVCSAVLNAVQYTGATPVVVDIEPLTFNISADAVQEAVNPKTKAVVVPHMFGCPAELNRLSELGLPLVEDCAQAVGAQFLGRNAGSFGLLSIFSFYATKVMTTAEGGMVLSDSKNLISKVKSLRDYDEREEFSVRYNYKMTDIQAALGLAQLGLLEKFIASRREIAARYFEEFKGCDFSLPVGREGKEHIYYRFVVKTKDNASAYLEKLQQKKVMCRRPVYYPLHKYLRLSGFPNTMEAWERTISIPLYPSLTEKEIEKVIAAVKEIF